MRVLKDELQGLLEVVMESGRLGWKGQGRKKERRTHVTASDREVRRKEKENRCNDDV